MRKNRSHIGKAKYPVSKPNNNYEADTGQNDSPDDTTYNLLTLRTWKMLYDCEVSMAVDQQECMKDKDMDGIKRTIRSFLPACPRGVALDSTKECYKWRLTKPYVEEGCFQEILPAPRSYNGQNLADKAVPFHNSRVKYSSTGAGQCAEERVALYCVPSKPHLASRIVPTGRWDNMKIPLPVRVQKIIPPVDFPKYFEPRACPGLDMIFREGHGEEHISSLPYYSYHKRRAARRGQSYTPQDDRTDYQVARRFWRGVDGWYWDFLRHPQIGWFCFEYGRVNATQYLGCFSLTQRQIEALRLEDA